MSHKFTSFLSKYFPKKPASLFSAQALETFKFDELDFQTKKGKKLLYTTFRRYPLVFQALKLRAALAIPSIELKTDDPKAERVLAVFLSNLHPASGLLALKSFLRGLWLDAELFGTSFIDPVWNKQKTQYLAFKKIHPISIDLKRKGGGFGQEVEMDSKGNPTAWVQEINNKKHELPFDDIAFLSFNQIGDEILGVSLVEPIYKTTWRLMNIEEGLATAIFRHGFPLYDITISGGIDGRPPTKEQLDDAAKQVKGLNYKSEFIHPPNYKVKLLEAFSIGKGEDYTNNFVNLICSATGLPRFFLLGSGKDVSKAATPEMLKIIKPSLEENLAKLKLFFEEQVLKPLMDANHIKEVPELIIGDYPLTEKEIEEKPEKPETPKDLKESGVTDSQTLPESWQDPKLIPKKNKKEKDLEDLEKSKKLPGLYLTSPHANLIYEGDKKQIVKSPHGAKLLKKYIGKEMYLVSDDKVFGIIKLREPHEININDFIQLRYAHKVSDEERKDWWPKERKLFSFEFDIVELFTKIKHFDVPRGIQTTIKQVAPQ